MGAAAQEKNNNLSVHSAHARGYDEARSCKAQKRRSAVALRREVRKAQPNQ